MAVLTTDELKRLRHIHTAFNDLRIDQRVKYLDSDGSYNGPITLDDITDTLLVGTQADLSGSGIALSSSVTGAVKVYSDDAGADLNAADSVRGMLSRLLLTTSHTGCTIRALEGQLKILTGKTVTSGVYTANQGYVELVGTLGVASAAHLSCVNASLELGGVLTVASGGLACGVHVETTGAGTITNSGDCAGIMIDKATSAASWPAGILIDGPSVIRGLRIGKFASSAATTGGVLFAAAMDIYSDGQLDAMEVHGATDSLLTGNYSVKCGRFRHIVNVSGTVEAELYGLVGQVVAKTAVIGLYAAGLMGTIESNGGFHVGDGASTSYPCSAGVIGRPGGASITVDTGSVLAGIAALSNTSSMTVTGTGQYAGLYVGRCQSTNTAFEIGLLISASSATTGIEIEACTTGLAITGICTNAITITGANTTSGISISGDQVLGVLFHATAAATAAYAVTVPTSITLDKGLDINVTSNGIVTSGITMQGTGTFTTGITMSASSIVTGISMTGTMTTGISMTGPNVTQGIKIGTESFASSGTAIVVDGDTLHSGCEFYFDDGGVELAAGYTEAFRCGYLVSTAISPSVDASIYTAHDYIYLAASVTTSGGVGATWASLLVKTGMTITTDSGLCDFSAFNASVDVPSGAFIGTGTWACGLAIGGNLGGTHTGNAAGVRLRVPSAGKWDVGLRIEPTSCVEFLQVGTASFSAAGTAIPLNGTTQHSGAEIYFDDGGTMLAAGYTEAMMTGFLVSQAITTADVSIYTVHDYIYLAASVSTAGGVGASWASLLAKTGAVLTTTSGVCDFSAFNASCDVPSGATIGTGTFVAGISMGGNLGGTHTGKAVAFRVRTPSAGAWDGVFDMPTAMKSDSVGGGALVYIPIYIGGVAAKLVANYVAQ